jgi:hypothetical protein
LPGRELGEVGDQQAVVALDVEIAPDEAGGERVLPALVVEPLRLFE